MNKQTLLRLALVSLVVLFFVASYALQRMSQPHPDMVKYLSKSRNYKDGEFVNPNGVKGEIVSWENLLVLKEYITTKRVDPVPKGIIPYKKIIRDEWEFPVDPDLKYAWLGHSSMLIAIEGTLVLVDPVCKKFASPRVGMGPKRFFSPPAIPEEFPGLDVVLITHDHYDHLEELTIRTLQRKTKLYIVPFGIGPLLRSWGIPEKKIVELDWEESHKVGSITFTATPAIHYSSRGLFDVNHTLWVSWAMLGEKRRLFVSGDSGYYDGFKAIGQKYGPFDVTFLKIGSYSDKGTWRKLHMTPEEAVQQHIDLKGKVMVPLHWATFDLALHSWYEPIERAIREAGKQDVNLVIPEPGKPVQGDDTPEDMLWWKESIQKLGKHKKRTPSKEDN